MPIHDAPRSAPAPRWGDAEPASQLLPATDERACDAAVGLV